MKLIKEPFQEYLSKQKDYLSSHRLADFRRCPLLYQKRKLGLIEDKQTTAFLVGRAAHTLILEGLETFISQYGCGPVNEKTGAQYGQGTKAWADWEKTNEKTGLTTDQSILLFEMQHSIKNHPLAKTLLHGGIAEGVVRGTYHDVPCQGRIDYWRAGEFIDFKTCDDLNWFEADAKRYGYFHQLAFYRALLRDILEQKEVAIFLIAAEKKEPYRSGVFRVGEGALMQCEKENREAMERLLYCERENFWPTGYEEVRDLELV
jgi:hypothetical protein